MKLRTQLSSAILLIGIVPLLLQGVLSYNSHRRDLSQSVLNHLQSVASIQQSRLTAIMQQNEERLALVASRTQLRINLDRHQTSGEPTAAASMNRILADAAGSIADIVGITVYDRAGMAAASTDPTEIGRPHPDPELFAVCSERTVVDRLYLEPEDGAVRVVLSGPMSLEGRHLGVILIHSRADNLLASIGDYAGLGETGETILARMNDAGHYVFLAPTRFAPGAALREMREFSGQPGLGHTLFGEARSDHWQDYRGVTVLAAVRPVPDTDWVLAVKMDRSEAFASLNRTATVNLLLVVVFGVIVIVVALRYAHGLSRPLSELATAAADITAGDYGRQVKARSTEEIGVLETSFNAMSAEVAESRQRLESKIVELNQALHEIKTLAGIIPICAACKKIRDDQGYWNQLEAYLTEHSDARFSHGLCPDCLQIFEDDMNEE